MTLTHKFIKTLAYNSGFEIVRTSTSYEVLPKSNKLILLGKYFNYIGRVYTAYLDTQKQLIILDQYRSFRGDEKLRTIELDLD